MRRRGLRIVGAVVESLLTVVVGGVSAIGAAPSCVAGLFRPSTTSTAHQTAHLCRCHHYQHLTWQQSHCTHSDYNKVIIVRVVISALDDPRPHFVRSPVASPLCGFGQRSNIVHNLDPPQAHVFLNALYWQVSPISNRFAKISKCGFPSPGLRGLPGGRSRSGISSFDIPLMVCY